MKVLMLTADYPPAVWSGIGVAVALEASALASLGVEVHVLVAAPRRMEPCVTVSGVTEHSLSTRRFPFDPGGFDLVHLHSLALSELALELCRRFSLPLVYTVHSWLPLELGNRAAAAFWCAVQGRVMAASHRVIFLSEADRAEAVKLLPELQEKARRIPNPVPPPGRSRLGPADSGLLVFAGRFVRSKGLACIEGIMERLGAAPHLRLVLAGGHGDAEGERIIDTVLTRFPDSFVWLRSRPCEWAHRYWLPPTVPSKKSLPKSRAGSLSTPTIPRSGAKRFSTYSPIRMTCVNWAGKGRVMWPSISIPPGSPLVCSQKPTGDEPGEG
jgi:hypothetical protein